MGALSGPHEGKGADAVTAYALDEVGLGEDADRDDELLGRGGRAGGARPGREGKAGGEEDG